MDKKVERVPWVRNAKEFPKVIRNGPLYDLKNEPEYEAAKSGDAGAALQLVDRMMRTETLEQLQTLLRDRKPLIVPVLAVEQSGNNKIPLAVAHVLGDRLGLDVEYEIGQRQKVNRGGSNANHRLVFNPTFSGLVKKDQDYFIVDDTLTQGGTIASLRGYIESRGGSVLGAMVMTSKEYSLQIAVSDMAAQAIEKHGKELDHFLRKELGYGTEGLTYSEARAIKNSKDIDEIRVRFHDARYERSVVLDEKRVGKEKTEKNLENLIESLFTEHEKVDKKTKIDEKDKGSDWER